MKAVVALSGTVAGLVGLALFFAGPQTYEDIARANGFERQVFHVPARAEPRMEVRYDIATLAGLHEWTLRYVLSAPLAHALPRDPTIGDPLFTLQEQRHLDDVRGVFAAARIAAVAAALLGAGLLLAVSRRGSGASARVLRTATLVAIVAVAAIGLLAAIAFEPAFLAFHYVVFPQGNFLFDPATSNLLALYPEPYWYGVTLRIGIAFVVIAGLVAGSAHLSLGATRSR